MAKKSGSGCFAVGVLLLAYPVYLMFAKYGWIIFWISIAVIVCLFVLNAITSFPVKCPICGYRTKHLSTVTDDNGNERFACIKCASAIERKNRKDAVKRFFTEK